MTITRWVVAKTFDGNWAAVRHRSDPATGEPGEGEIIGIFKDKATAVGFSRTWSGQAGQGTWPIGQVADGPTG